MELKAAQCPNCGGELQLPEDKNNVTCMYCNSSISVKEAIEKKTKALSGSIETWQELARSAKNGGDNLEAIKYFNKILEVDSSNSEAWYGKAICLYNTSTLANIKINEAVSYIKNAIKYSNNDIALKKKAALELYTMAVNLYDTSWAHALNYMSVAGTGEEHGRRSCYCLEALRLAVELDNKVEYVERALKIHKAYGKYHNDSVALKSFFETKMKELNPSWEPSKGCFIATATIGSYDHPEVMELRNFRDNWILEKKWGESFVTWYYHYGSVAAKSIEKSFVLKRICYLLIVKPLVYLSRIVKK